MGFVNTYQSFEELNQAIDQAGSIINLLKDQFTTADTNKIGTDNFYGKDWE